MPLRSEEAAHSEALEAQNKIISPAERTAREAAEKEAAQKADEQEISKEKADNMESIKTAKQGLAAVTQAIDILKVFYKQSAKNKEAIKLQGELKESRDIELPTPSGGVNPLWELSG